MAEQPIEVDAGDEDDGAAPSLEFVVAAICDACGNQQVITIYSLNGDALDACGTVCPCGEVAWLVRFSAHPDAKWSGHKGLDEVN